jgi:hypothetical protein
MPDVIGYHDMIDAQYRLRGARGRHGRVRRHRHRKEPCGREPALHVPEARKAGRDAAVLLATGLAARFVPAWRAGRVDPADTLRQD